MGIDATGVRFLGFAKKQGVDFSRTAMIGRQGFYILPGDLREALSSVGLKPQDRVVEGMCSHGGFSEGLFQYLGGETIHSFDFSDFEGATYTHDMNLPITDVFKEKYSAVLDGGSLEHVFNFPVAIKNCMEMVEVGGHYLAITPANNFFGHGFYQFSPELYFSVLSPENGFEIVEIIALEEANKSAWFAIRSPRETRSRVELRNAEPVHLLVIARRMARKVIFERPPQQSDYTVRWQGEDNAAHLPQVAPPSSRPFHIRIAKMLLPVSLRLFIRNLLARPEKPVFGFDPKFFRRVDPASHLSRQPSAPVSGQP